MKSSSSSFWSEEEAAGAAGSTGDAPSSAEWRSPLRVGIGRAGLRYRTAVALQLRADQAVAKDAVAAELPAGFAEAHGWLELWTRCRDRGEYLLRPDLGRRLTPESQALLEHEGIRAADVQLIVGDGLSAPAVELNAPALVPMLAAKIRATGLSVGRPLLVRRARVGVQDVVGVGLGARATLLLIGERPGLGGGDSLSVYLAYGPRLDQDNAEKNCISNIRPRGLQHPEAVREAVSILLRAFALGGGGVRAQARS